MAVSIDAILFYGYCWSEECLLISDETDWMEILLQKRGVPNPYDSWPGHQPGYMEYQKLCAVLEAWGLQHKPELDAWRKAKDAIQVEYGVDIDRHCSHQCNMPFVYAVGSKFVASRGHPEPVDSLAIDPTWYADLERFMTDLEIPKPAGQIFPQWWLVSWCG